MIEPLNVYEIEVQLLNTRRGYGRYIRGQCAEGIFFSKNKPWSSGWTQISDMPTLISKWEFA